MVGVTYFPNDGIDKDNSSFLMTELIENISQLQSKGHHCILLGDFNGKIGEYRVEGKASFNGDLLEKLIETADMKVLNKSPLCTGKYTWHRGSTKTTIDYALISSSLENNIDSVIIDEVGDYDLGSDHNTICVSFNSSECKNNAPLVKNIMKWKINEVKDWSAFRLALSAKFANFECDLSQPINQTWLGWKQIVTEVGEQYVGKKEIKDDKKHVCDKETKKLIQNRRTANRFYRYWAGKETCDPEILQELWQEYLRRKRDVHEKIKTIKVQNKIKVISLNSRKGTKNTRSYWRMLKRLNGNNGHPLKICDPNDKSKIINDPKRISEILGTYWKNLGNSGSPTGDKDLNNTLMEHLSCDGDKVDMSGLTDIVIDENTTWNAISKLKNGKACGIDNIPNEFLKHGGEAIVNSLTKIFKLCKILESFPDDWSKGYTKPIYKDGKPELLSSYRGITITSNVYKVFASMLETQMMSFYEEQETFGELQGAYRQGRRLEDHYFSLKGLCSLRKDRKEKTWLAFLDISKAFDTVNRNRMMCELWNSGIQGKTWRLVHRLYEKVENKVIFGPFESNWYESVNGVKQGCILSPTLFSIVMNDLLFMLNEQRLGITYHEELIPALLYADDIVLMANDDKQLQEMLNIAHRFAIKWGMKFNDTKSKVMVIGKKMDMTRNWFLGTLTLEECTMYKYLGIIFAQSLQDSPHIKQHLKGKLSRLNGYICSILSSHDNINRVTFGDSLWKSLIMPSLSHGSAVWFNNTKESTSIVRSFQYTVARAILQVRGTPAMVATLGEFGWLPLITILNKQRVKYYHHVKYNIPANRLCKRVLCDLETNFHSGHKSCWPYMSQISTILSEAGLDNVNCRDTGDWIYPFCKLSTQNYVYDFFKDIDEMSSLSYYKLIKYSTLGERYMFQVNDFKGTRLKFMARTGCLGLEETLQRWNLSNGICKLCNQGIEDLFHFTFTCEHSKELRIKIWRNLEKCLLEHGYTHVWEHFTRSSLTTKFTLLFGISFNYDHAVNDIFDSACKTFLKEAWRCRMVALEGAGCDISV